MAQKIEIGKEISCFWSAGCSLLRAEGFSCSLDVLYGGLWISYLHFFIKKIIHFFQLYIFCNFWSSKPWIQIRIGIPPKMLNLNQEWIESGSEAQKFFYTMLSEKCVGDPGSRPDLDDPWLVQTFPLTPTYPLYGLLVLWWDLDDPWLVQTLPLTPTYPLYGLLVLRWDLDDPWRVQLST